MPLHFNTKHFSDDRRKDSNSLSKYRLGHPLGYLECKLRSEVTQLSSQLSVNIDVEILTVDLNPPIDLMFENNISRCSWDYL